MRTLLQKENSYKKVFTFLFILAVLVNIKSIFTDYNIDSGYAVATSYRMILGDQMFFDMWEPHQTSAFLCTFLMKIYMTITGTTTGIVIFLHAAGVLLKGLFTYLIYRTLKPYINPIILGFMCIFCFAVSPKGMPLPEFSNMQLWFSIGLFCCLFKHFNQSGKLRYLLLSGLFLCLEIISYPSCIIVFFGVIGLILLYSERKFRDILIFSGECFLMGISYLSLFIFKIGLTPFIQTCRYIIAGDESHDMSLLEKFIEYTKELAIASLLFIVIAIISLVVQKITQKNAVYIFFILVYICDFTKTITSSTGYYFRFPIYMPFVLFSLFILHLCNETERKLYIIGLVISSSSFFATLILTNLSFAASINYLILGIMVSFIPISKYLELHPICIKETRLYSGFFIFLLLTIFFNGYITKTMNAQHTNLFHVRGVVKQGPALGIFSEYMGPYIMNVTIPEWKENINPGDRVLVVSAGTLDPLIYLYQDDVEISMASTICTPTYDEKLLTYWELHPEKKPNVVAIECWFGDIRVPSDAWILEWLASEFIIDEYTDGTYWRFYRK